MEHLFPLCIFKTLKDSFSLLYPPLLLLLLLLRRTLLAFTVPSSHTRFLFFSLPVQSIVTTPARQLTRRRKINPPLFTHQIKEDENVIFVSLSGFYLFFCSRGRQTTTSKRGICHVLPKGEQLLTASSIRDGEEKDEKKRGTPPPRKHNQSESCNSHLNGAAFQILV